MTCPSYPNPISILDVSNEFGRGQTTMSLTEYYANGSRVRPGTVGYPLGNPTQIPGGGTLSLGNFHGATRIAMYKFYSSQWWTCPPGVYNPLVMIVGGGGGGGSTYGYTGFGALPPGGGGGGAGGIWVGRVACNPGEGIWIEVGGGGAGGGASPNGRGGNGAGSVFRGIGVPGGGGGGGALITTVQEYRDGYWQDGGGGKNGSGPIWVPSPGYVSVQKVLGSGADGASGGGACVIDSAAIGGNPSNGNRGGYPINFGGAAFNGGGGGYGQRGGDGGPAGSYGGQGVLINMDNFEQVWVCGGGGAGNHFLGNAVIPGGTGGGGAGGGIFSGATAGAFGTGGGGGGGGSGFGGNGGSGTVWVLG